MKSIFKSFLLNQNDTKESFYFYNVKKISAKSQEKNVKHIII